MAKGAPTVACHDDGALFLAALPLGSGTAVHGALCVARTAKGFSHGDVRHLRHAAGAVGSALTRIAALAAEREAEHAFKLAESALRAAAEDRVLLAEQMVGIVSHDLRNPLSAILTGITLMAKGEALPVQKERVLQKVRSATQRAQRLVDELLDFTQARVGQGLVLKRVDVDLHGLMVSIVDELRLSFPSGRIRWRRSGAGIGLSRRRPYPSTAWQPGCERRRLWHAGNADPTRVRADGGRTGPVRLQRRRTGSASHVRHHVRAHDARPWATEWAAWRWTGAVYRARHCGRSPRLRRCHVKCRRRDLFFGAHSGGTPYRMTPSFPGAIRSRCLKATVHDAVINQDEIIQILINARSLLPIGMASARQTLPAR